MAGCELGWVLALLVSPFVQLGIAPKRLPNLNDISQRGAPKYFGQNGHGVRISECFPEILYRHCFSRSTPSILTPVCRKKAPMLKPDRVRIERMDF